MARCSAALLVAASVAAAASAAECNMTKVGMLTDMCPGLSNPNDNPDDVAALKSDFCETGDCKSLIDSLKADCNDTDTVAPVLEMEKAMCGGDFTKCPEDDGMVMFAVMSACPKTMAEMGSGRRLAGHGGGPPAEVLAELCDSGACLDKREEMEKLCEGNAAVEGNLTELEEVCEHAGHDHGDGDGDGDGTKGTASGGSVVAPGLASVAAAAAAAWLQ